MITKNTVILLSKAKQSHNCLLNNNFKFYISQSLKAFKFLSVSFLLHNKFDNIAQGAKASLLFKNIITRGFNPLRLFAFAHNGLKPHCYKKWIASSNAFIMTIKNNFAILNLVKTFCTATLLGKMATFTKL